MKWRNLILAVLSLGLLFPLQGQIVQNFNESVNQIGDCWQNYNMKIETQNTINKANHRKALTGITPHGYPAYYFMSPIISFNATGSISFRHKLTANDGIDRELKVYLLDQSERVVSTLHSYTYRQGNTSPNGNATIVVNVNIPITWSGIYIVRWEFSGSGGTSLGMVDDILIDGEDLSDGSNDNGYGYCRPDDEVWDTVCAGEVVRHKVPHPIPQSTWQWQFFGGPAAGVFDSTIVADEKDTVVEVSWSYQAAGDYYMEATEIRPPYYTDSYSVLFNIHVLPAPAVTLHVDSVCPGDTSTAIFEFTGTGPWEIEYKLEGVPYSFNTSNSTVQVVLPYSLDTRSLQVINVSGGNGCSPDPNANPTVPVVVFAPPSAGPIYR